MGSSGRKRSSGSGDVLSLDVIKLDTGAGTEESVSEEEAKEEEKRFIDQVEYDRDRKYKEWDDKASGGWTYGGTGKDQEDFFAENSNSDELITNMDSEERSAFKQGWTPGRFMRGQQYMGFDKMTDQEQQWTRIYDKILDRATLKEGIVVTRRASAELILGKGHTRASSLEELKALRGKLVTSKGNMSTGAAKEGLTIGDSGKNVEYRIHIAGGTKGAGMWIGDSRINGWGSEQREFMTNRDSVYAVGRTSYDKRRDIYVVNMYYVGREPHDYGKRGK